MYMSFVTSFAFIPKHVSCFMQHPGIKLETEYHPTDLCFKLQSLTIDRN